jgi:hypothetical protein
LLGQSVPETSKRLGEVEVVSGGILERDELPAVAEGAFPRLVSRDVESTGGGAGATKTNRGWIRKNQGAVFEDGFWLALHVSSMEGFRDKILWGYVLCAKLIAKDALYMPHGETESFGDGFMVDSI